MQKIYINGKFLCQKTTGVHRYAAEILHALDDIIEECNIKEFSFELVTPFNAPNFYLRNIKILKTKPKIKIKGYIWEQFILPLYVRGSLLLNLCNSAPIIKRNQIVTLHDAAVFDQAECFEKILVIWYRLLFKMLARRCRFIVTDSQFSKERLIHHLQLSDNKIKVVYCAVSNTFHPQEANLIGTVKTHYSLTSKYFLFVGSLEPRKNLSNVFKAWNLVRGDLTGYSLVIVGLSGRGFKNKGFTDIPENVTFLGYVPDEYMIPLLAGATALVYVSLYEGFGLPPLEAMAVGTPVIVSGTTSLPEVVGDSAGFFCNPSDPASIAKGFLFFADDENNRGFFRVKGFERARFFSWKQSAKSILDLIRSNLNNKN